MDHDDHLVGTMLSRRDALRAATVAGVSLVFGHNKLWASEGHRQRNAVNLVATPEIEEGPFFVDEELNRKDITLDTSRKSVVNGSPILLHLSVHELQGKKLEPIRGAHIDVWHADANGAYSDEVSGTIQREDTKGQKWLRGYQITDHYGRAEFRTIYPGWYANRTPHIHVKVRRFDSNTNKTYVFNTQLFFEEAINDLMLNHSPYNDRGERRVRNLWDGLYTMKQEDGTMTGSRLRFSVEKSPDGIVERAHFAIAFNLR